MARHSTFTQYFFNGVSVPHLHPVCVSCRDFCHNCSSLDASYTKYEALYQTSSHVANLNACSYRMQYDLLFCFPHSQHDKAVSLTAAFFASHYRTSSESCAVSMGRQHDVYVAY